VANGQLRAQSTGIVKLSIRYSPLAIAPLLAIRHSPSASLDFSLNFALTLPCAQTISASLGEERIGRGLSLWTSVNRRRMLSLERSVAKER
jgi:hypothetical protein